MCWKRPFQNYNSLCWRITKKNGIKNGNTRSKINIRKTQRNRRMAIRKRKTKLKVHRILLTRNRTNTNRNNLIYIAHNIKRIFNEIKKQTQQILTKNNTPTI